MTKDERTRERLRRNEESRNWATHDKEPWGFEEIEELLGYWDGTEETLVEISKLLGRTIEACRQRYYDIISGRKKITSVTITQTTILHIREESPRGWLVGYCFTCGRHGDVYSDGNIALCEDCRG